MPRFSADFIVLSADRWLRNATLVVEQGMVRAVHTERSSRVDRAFHHAIIAPGLINAHAHLDLTLFPRSWRPAPPANFFDWVREIVAYRRCATLDELRAAVQTGVQQCLAAGITAVGDIVTLGLPPRDWLPLRGVLFGELLGAEPRRIEAVRHAAQQWLDAAQAAAARLGSLAISFAPHAPYSTARCLYEWAAAQCPNLPLTTHLFELPEEAALLERSAGAERLVEFLKEMAAWAPEALWNTASLVTFLERAGSRWLLAHANYAPPETLARVSHRVAVVFCPRTHAYFGHGQHPWSQLQRRGVLVMLGTDSVASSETFDLLHEANEAVRRCGMSPAEAFRMVTERPAAALALQRAGSLEPGHWADFFVARPPALSEDPITELLDPRTQVVATFIAGRPVYEADG